MTDLKTFLLILGITISYTWGVIIGILMERVGK